MVYGNYISKDLALGLFFGGTIGMIICAILDIWSAMGMAPLVLIILLDGVLAIDALIAKLEEQNTRSRRKKR
jgi:hypothetical protein